MRRLTAFAVLLIILGPACSDSTKPTESTAPQTPSGFRLLGAGDGQVLLAWEPSPEPDLAGYILYRAINPSLVFDELVRTNATQFSDRYLSYDTTYAYRLTAYDFVGNESKPTQAVSVRPINFSAPMAPTGVVAMGKNWTYPPKTGIEVRWVPGEETDLSYYRIYRGEDAAFEAGPTSFVDSTLATFFLDGEASIGVPTYYRLIATDQGGLQSHPGAAASDRPLAKARLISPAGNSQVSLPFELKWEAVAGAEGYEVEVNLYPYSQTIWKSALLGSGTTSTTYAGPTLQSGQSYTWWVATYSRIAPTDSEGRPVTAEPNSQSDYARFIYR